MATDTLYMRQRADVLRTLETECYRICYALLEDERLSLWAAKRTIGKLFLEEGFYALDRQRQRQHMRRLSVREALHVAGSRGGPPG